MSDWGPETVYGVSTATAPQAAVDTAPGIAVAAPNRSVLINASGLTHDNWVVWVVGLIGVTAGLIGFSSSGRVGPVRGSLSVGRK